jgi:hypothetical protein
MFSKIVKITFSFKMFSVCLTVSGEPMLNLTKVVIQSYTACIDPKILMPKHCDVWPGYFHPLSSFRDG